MTIEQAINAALSTDRILSLILVILAIWFTRTGWGDLVALWKDGQAIRRLQAETECDREMERIRAEIEIQRQTVQELAALNSNLTDYFAEVRAIGTIQNVEHDVLIHILDRLNGRRDVQKAAQTADFNS